MKTTLTTIALAITLAVWPTSLLAQPPLGSEWTYQGRLHLSGSPVNDTADFEFTLWDADVDGNMIGDMVAVDDVDVVDGLFTALLDFGVEVFDSDARWLEVAVRSPAGGGEFTTLEPRQPLTATPYSLQTRGIFVDDAGNVGIGTNNPTAALQVNGSIIAGDLANFISEGVVGGTISGGGSTESPNSVRADRATVGGGRGNTASGYHSTIGGGLRNVASEFYSTVSGGLNNTASNVDATVGGGCLDTASGEGATVGGGFMNVASGRDAVVGGGWRNTATGDRTTVGGGRDNTASGHHSTVGGEEATPPANSTRLLLGAAGISPPAVGPPSLGERSTSLAANSRRSLVED